MVCGVCSTVTALGHPELRTAGQRDCCSCAQRRTVPAHRRFAQACRSHADAIMRVIVLAGTCSPFHTHFRIGVALVQVIFTCCGVGGITPSLSTRVAVWLTACCLPADYVFVVTIKPAASAASTHTERFKADLMVCLHEYPPPALALPVRWEHGSEPADQGGLRGDIRACRNAAALARFGAPPKRCSVWPQTARLLLGTWSLRMRLKCTSDWTSSIAPICTARCGGCLAHRSAVFALPSRWHWRGRLFG